jgi:hypothetical protein
LAVRKVLRENETLRAEYGELKMSLAKEEHADIGSYGAKKHAMIQEILIRSYLSKEDLERINSRPKRRIDSEIQRARLSAESAGGKTR